MIEQLKDVYNLQNINRYDSLKCVNLYAFISTDPKELWRHDNPIGPENNNYLRKFFSNNKMVICAWGSNAKIDRVIEVYNMLNNLCVEMYCLGITKAGMPRHPLLC